MLRLWILVGLVACGDNLAPVVEIPLPPAPHISSAGGPVLVAPRIVPIFYAGDDDMQAQVEAFLHALATSSYWTAVTSEYGVGPPTIEPTIVVSDPPPTTDDALQGLLEANLEPPVVDLPLFVGQTSGWPAPDANTLYVVFLPAGVTLTAGSDVSCMAFGGYHYETAPSHIAYALIPRCTPTGAPIDKITPALSHELVEAATDPRPRTAPAFAVIDRDDVVWGYTPGAELGDMCEYIRAARQRLVGDYLVQRTWSNISAAAGHDPCVPAPAAPYVAAAPLFGDVTFAVAGKPITTHGVKIANGSSATIELELFSDTATADWTVVVEDVASAVQMLPAELSLTLDKTTGNDGDKLELTIKRLKDGQGGGSELVIVSKVGGETVSLWWGLVTN
jgi:hypothetical protein